MAIQHPEVFIKFKANEHPWEKAYVGVFSHPFFAVSDDSGVFRIEGLPPGDYSIVAWHEKNLESEQPRLLLLLAIQDTELHFRIVQSHVGKDCTHPLFIN